MKLGYLGPMTNSEIAAKKPDSIDELIAYSSMEDVFSALEQDKVDRIVVPVYNSIRGDIKYRLWIDEYGFEIEKEFEIQIRHCIASSNGSIDVVMSHEEALKQCNDYLDINYPYVKREATKSTAEAAKIISETKKGAAIANLETCLHYGLRIIDKDIVKDNYSTFVLLRK
ncbi:MAG: prephenate dehydratase domain-containing protein [Candidatus Woesearchaeota archaeon]